MTTTTSAKQSPTIVLNLPSAINQLVKEPSGRRILSAFIDTSPARLERHAHLLAFRDGCKAIRPHLDGAEKDLFEAAVRHVERYLLDAFTQKGLGVALFLGAPGSGLIVVPLPRRPVLEHVSWSEQPEISPLKAMLDDAERVALVLFDTRHARLFTMFLGEIETQQAFVDHVPAKQATGGWFGLQQTNFSRHREDHLRRHAEHTVRALMELLRTASFDRLLVAGPEEPVTVLRHEMPRPLRSRLAGKLDLEVFATDAEVLAAGLKAADQIERREELRLVEELLDSASSTRVAVGVAGTLNALAEERVYLLLLADLFDAGAAQCRMCGRLVTDAQRCPACGSATQPIRSLREEVVRQALAQDANVEVVAGPAAARLIEYGGIGAWTRF